MENRDVLRKDYRVYKGYTVKTRKRVEIFDQQFIVPWEMTHDTPNTFKKTIH